MIGLGLLGVLLVVGNFFGIEQVGERRDLLMQGMGFAATMALIAVLIHSVADFNLHIPADAATFMVVLALAWASRYANHGA
jgi:hypothetical protein